MAINKVIVNGEIKLDLTADTATADKVLKGFTFHDATGELKTGTNGGGIDGYYDGYYIKKAFDSYMVSNYSSIHVDVTTEGTYGLFYINNLGEVGIQIDYWYNDSAFNDGGAVYAISTQPITYINYYENSSSSSTSSY